jgi:hypothetical protein
VPGTVETRPVRRESDPGEQLSKKLLVINETMFTVHAQMHVECFAGCRGIEIDAAPSQIRRRPAEIDPSDQPSEIRCQKPHHAATFEDAVALLQYPLPALEIDVLDEVLGVDVIERARSKGKAERQIGDDVTHRGKLDVDIDPAREVMVPRAQVQLRARGGGGDNAT